MIGIIGQGFVGNAVYKKFKNFYDVLTYDLDKDKMKKMGLVWRGKGYGKEGEKGILYKNVDGKSVPSQVLISYMKGSKITRINLEYSQFDFPENLNFPMEIPSDYKRINLDEIIK